MSMFPEAEPRVTLRLKFFWKTLSDKCFYFSGDQKATLIQAMRHWENFTCLSFIERTTEKDYVFFHKGRCGWVMG